MGWRRELKKRRKLARVQKKELYVKDANYRAQVDERRKNIVKSAISIGGAITNLLPGAKGVGEVMHSLKARNELNVNTQAATRSERLAIDEKLRGYSVVPTTKKDSLDGIDKKTLVYIGIAAVGLLLFAGK